MGKKLIGILVSVLMLFGVFEITACTVNIEFENYKVEAKEEIESYAIENNYNEDNWKIICDFVETGKQAIDAAENKTDVDNAINDTKIAIDNVAKEREMQAIFFTEATLNLGFGTGPDISVIVKKRSDLEAFLSEHNGNWVDIVKEHYLDEFFEKKALILHFAVTSSVSVEYILDDVKLIKGTLTLCLIGEYYGDTMLDAEGFRSFLIEVNKKDITNNLDFEVAITYEHVAPDTKSKD